MKTSFLLMVFGLLPLNAFASEIKVIPVIPIDCKQKQTRAVSFADVQELGEQNGRLYFSLQVSSGSCSTRKIALKEVGDNYDLYLVNDQYSSDFTQTDYKLTSKSVEVQMSLIPEVFFQEFGTRTFNMSYYPGTGTLHFEWKLIFKRDPATNKVTLQTIRL